MNSSSSDSIDYSIIIPVYYNEGSLKITFDRLKELVFAKNPGLAPEVIFVDDGSGDNSFRELLQVRQENPGTVRVIKLTRNFGQIYARLAGYHHARGKCMIHLTADLQDPPELINQMLDQHFNHGYEIVIGIRNSRDESFYRRVTSRFFYSMMKKLIFPAMPEGGFDYHMISKKVRDYLVENKEANPFIQGQLLWSGYKVKKLPYDRQKRPYGRSRWSFSKKIKLLIDGLMAYSYFPLRLMTTLGSVVALLGFIWALRIFILRIIGEVPVKGWAPLMIVVLILSGIQMLMIGIIGEYLWRTLDQVRGRPPYIIEEIFD